MREVTLDVTRLLGRALRGRVATGIDRVGLAYVEHFGARAQALVRLRGAPIRATRRSSERLFARLLEAPSEPASRRWKLLEAAARLVPDVTRPAGRMLLHTGHGGLERAAFLERWRSAGGLATAFVHDLIPITHPEVARPGEADKHRRRMRSALEHGSAIVVNSNATRRELEAFAAREDLRVPPTLVAHLGVPLRGSPSPARPLEAPYFAVVGTIEARKNHWLLLQVWRRIVETQGSAAPKLVILGQRGWECENVVDLLDRCDALRSTVLEKPGVSDEELARYVQHAQALLFPSLVEGYGLPLVEALAAGVPVVASDLPVFREIAGDLPLYADPLDGPAWRAHVEALAPRGSTLAAELRARARAFQPPTWRDHFASVDAFLESLSETRA